MEMGEITISLSKNLLDRIEQIAAQRNISVAEFLAEIMEKIVANYEITEESQAMQEE